MMEYVLMTPEHTAQIAAIEEMCFSAPWSEDAIRSELSNPLSLWYVALADGKVVGYVGSQSVIDESDMMNLAVLPEYRRGGVARNLVEHLVEHLRRNGIHSLTLEVRASNIAAMRLYEGLGFALVGRRPNYYAKPKEDAMILRKEWEV